MHFILNKTRLESTTKFIGPLAT